jgi:hypothetical protein
VLSAQQDWQVDYVLREFPPELSNNKDLAAYSSFLSEGPIPGAEGHHPDGDNLMNATPARASRVLELEQAEEIREEIDDQ